MSDESKLDPAQQAKLDIARQKKDAGDQSFKEGQVKDALRSYHECLMYLIGLHTTVQAVQGQGEAKNVEVEEILEKVYANMSACHIKQQNWKRALDTADKALAKNENNTKAIFRKAKALGELGYFEKAEQVLEDLLKKNPDEATAINLELSRLRAIEKGREKVANQKFKGFLSKERGEKKTALGGKSEGTS